MVFYTGINNLFSHRESIIRAEMNYCVMLCPTKAINTEVHFAESREAFSFGIWGNATTGCVQRLASVSSQLFCIHTQSVIARLKISRHARALGHLFGNWKPN